MEGLLGAGSDAEVGDKKEMVAVVEVVAEEETAEAAGGMDAVGEVAAHIEDVEVVLAEGDKWGLVLYCLVFRRETSIWVYR